MKRFTLLCIIGAFLFSLQPVTYEAASPTQVIVKFFTSLISNEVKENDKATKSTPKGTHSSGNASKHTDSADDTTEWVSINPKDSYLKNVYINMDDIREHSDPNAMPVRVKSIHKDTGTYTIKYLLAFKDAQYVRVEKTETYNLKSGQFLGTTPAYTGRYDSINGPIITKIFELQEDVALDEEDALHEEQEAKENAMLYMSIIAAVIPLIVGGLIGAFVGHRKAKKAVLPLLVLLLLANPIAQAEDWVKVPTDDSSVNMYLDADDIKKSLDNKAIEAAVKIEYLKNPQYFYVQNVLFLPDNLYLGVNNTTITDTAKNETRKLFIAGGFDGNKKFVYSDLAKEAWRIRHELEQAKAAEEAEIARQEQRKSLFILLGISIVSLLIGGGIGFAITNRRKSS
ncbi:hypothetical protein [uncultured Veillonella sp.]|uniref:hypothetical protein n=1 Tax=uncultured Veillonella sp. TaxID=159268 RepID=UPI002613C02E|nr:hypothetical protein [uncultured Veillonella sp.]